MYSKRSQHFSDILQKEIEIPFDILQIIKNELCNYDTLCTKNILCILKRNNLLKYRESIPFIRKNILKMIYFGVDYFIANDNVIGHNFDLTENQVKLLINDFENVSRIFNVLYKGKGFLPHQYILLKLSQIHDINIDIDDLIDIINLDMSPTKKARYDNMWNEITKYMHSSKIISQN
jgi:hypothetical protein